MLSVLGHQGKIIIPTMPQVQLVHAMLLVQGATFAGVTTHELYQELPKSMMHGSAGRCQRDQITRLESPCREPIMIKIESKSEEDKDFDMGRKQAPEGSPHQVPAVRPGKAPPTTELQMYSASLRKMVTVMCNSKKYLHPLQTYKRQLLNLPEYVRGQAPWWSSQTTTPSLHIQWVSA